MSHFTGRTAAYVAIARVTLLQGTTIDTLTTWL